MNKKKSLWTRNFTIITLGTMISAVGGVAMNLGLSLVVFDQTQSTWFSGIFAAISMLPGIALPVLLGPVIDRMNRKHIIAGLDAFSGIWYLAFLWYIHRCGFVYGAYLLFSFVIGCVGTVCDLTYQCLYPDLIPEGFAQKGYAVSGAIYPLATTVVTPLAALVYGQWGIESLFLAEGCLLLLAAAFESQIDYAHEKKQNAQSFAQYKADMLEGFRYLKREKGVRSIFCYMTVSGASANGVDMMALAHFQSSSVLTTAMYGLLTSAETIGRLIGSAVHYLFRIPEEKRYALTVRVYMIYELCDGLMLFLSYPLMLAARFLCGFLGSQTAAIRSAAVQNYLPADMRARVNGLFSVLVSIGMMLVQLAMGALGEIMPYRWAAILLAAFSLFMIFLVIVRGRQHVEPVYNRKV
ncbi:MAG: MFS transporter [Clostridia bacterium]|nr:MFS transporter [Clostridia bacterium]